MYGVWVDLVVSQSRRTPIYLQPYHRDPQKGTPIWGKTPLGSRNGALLLEQPHSLALEAWMPLVYIHSRNSSAVWASDA